MKMEKFKISGDRRSNLIFLTVFILLTFGGISIVAQRNGNRETNFICRVYNLNKLECLLTHRLQRNFGCRDSPRCQTVFDRR